MNQKREVETKTAQLEVWAVREGESSKGRKVRGRREREGSFILGKEIWMEGRLVEVESVGEVCSWDRDCRTWWSFRAVTYSKKK